MHGTGNTGAADEIRQEPRGAGTTLAGLPKALGLLPIAAAAIAALATVVQPMPRASVQHAGGRTRL